jgi:hypothetical protein
MISPGCLLWQSRRDSKQQRVTTKALSGLSYFFIILASSTSLRVSVAPFRYLVLAWDVG